LLIVFRAEEPATTFRVEEPTTTEDAAGHRQDQRTGGQPVQAADSGANRSPIPAETDH